MLRHPLDMLVKCYNIKFIWRGNHRHIKAFHCLWKSVNTYKGIRPYEWHLILLTQLQEQCEKAQQSRWVQQQQQQKKNPKNGKNIEKEELYEKLWAQNRGGGVISGNWRCKKMKRKWTEGRSMWKMRLLGRLNGFTFPFSIFVRLTSCCANN